MSQNNLSWMIGGPAGSGINRSSEIFALACVRAGLHVFSNIEYHSNIMGRHMNFRVRVSEAPVHSHVDHIDLLLALDTETLFGTDPKQDYQRHPGHLENIAPNGVVIADAKESIEISDLGRNDISLIALPYDDILREGIETMGVAYNPQRHGVMRNMVPVGASCALLNFDIDQVVRVVAERLPARRQDLVDLNREVLHCAWRSIRQRRGDTSFNTVLKARPEAPSNMLIRGVDAVAIGKVSAGCAFQTYYPIAPASDESEYLEQIQNEYPIVVLQAEDEIASINMAVGAAHAGVRASTSTAGPGFSLMSEGFGFAAMTEAPGPVVVLYQRGGPSTGLPTRQSQQDLRFAVQPSHGEFPHIVVAPGTIEEAAQYTNLAFNWGDRYQMPVVVLLDKFMANSWFTTQDLGLDGLPIDTGEVWAPSSNGNKPYLRHKVTPSGISPRAIFGTPGGMFVTTTDEHTERGRIDEDVGNRVEQMDKRMQKLDLAAREILPEQQYTLHGPTVADTTIVAWGSTRGAIQDAMPVLSAEYGITANHLQIRLMRPFPVDGVREILETTQKVLLLEDNFMGQLGLLIAEQTGLQIESKALKYDGRPFSQSDVIEAVLKHQESHGEHLVDTHS